MKGSRRSPSCGFSAQVVGILDELVPAYETVDVLQSPEVRDGIKEYSAWPTIPQLYVNGKFVGGCDIVREMHASGELGRLLGASEEAPAPAIAITEAAAAAFRDAREAEGDVLHLEIDASFAYGLFFGPEQPGEIEVQAGGIQVLMDRATARRADGLSIDYVSGADGAGFKMSSPHEPPRVEQLGPAQLKAMIDREEPFELFDVRTPRERETGVAAGLDAPRRGRPEEARGAAQGDAARLPLPPRGPQPARGRALPRGRLRAGLQPARGDRRLVD